MSFDYGADFVRQTSILRPDIQAFPDGATPDCAAPVDNICKLTEYAQEIGRLEVLWGTLGTVSVQLGPDHELTALTLFNRSTTDQTTYRTGFSPPAQGTFNAWQLEFVGRSLFFNQILGDHRNLFGTRLRLRWNGVVSTGRREEPDTRTVVYSDRTGEMIWYDNGRSGGRFFSDLQQLDVGGGLSLRFPLWQEAWATLGTQITLSSRTFQSRRFGHIVRQSDIVDSNVQLAPGPEVLFCPDCDGQGIGYITNFREQTLDTDGYEADQNLYASYLQVETPIVGELKLLTGARVEIFQQRLGSYAPFENADPVTEAVDRTDIDVLPAAQLVYKLNDEMYLRGGYGQTVARPQARELAPFQFYDFVRNRLIVGDPALERTRIHNVDLRWEWFFGTDDQTTELFAVSLFFKEFIDPIELQITNPVNITAIYTNAEGARNYGAEIEGQLSFGRFHRALDVLTLQGNIAILYSRVRFAPERAGSVTNPERRLFGQSPYVANLSLRFDEPDSGFAAALVYNVIGPRIVGAGVLQGSVGLPDEEQQAFHSLDLVASWQANEHLKLKFKGQNLLLDRRDYSAGPIFVESVRIGATFSVGVDVSY